MKKQMAKKLKCWRPVKEHEDRWRHKEDEPRVVDISNTFVGNRKPVVNVWREVNNRPPTPYLIHEKKFKNKREALKFANNYMKKHDKC